MTLSDNAIKVLESRYLLKNAEGKITETPEGLFRRVASHVSKAELKWKGQDFATKQEDEFFKIMSELKFLPNSPTLMNAGTDLNQLSACFVLPVEDTMEGIFTTLKNTALIQQSGGGTGFNFSKLRSKQDMVSSNAGNASGPVEFMKVYDAATQNIKQGGKRRGANMGILNINHPDIEDFISAKKTEGVLSNFNISVGVTNTFMKAVEDDLMWDLKKPDSGIIYKAISAKKLWDSLITNAWESGDPGLIFVDTINEFNPTPQLGYIDCTNPCGEVPLLPYEACNLGSINVSEFFKDNTINWTELEKVIYSAVRFLDNVIEINSFVIPEIESLVKGNRKIGLGVMGWAELLIKLDIPYQSEEALSLAEELMQFINVKSKKASVELAEERGVFINWEKSIYYSPTPIRNATRTSIAPTGTISIIANTSSSIEPLFALAIKRENVLDNETLEQLNPLFVSYLKTNNLFTDDILAEVIGSGTISNCKLPKKVKELFKTALEIEPQWHLRHQLAFQKYTDNAVSKTINLPTEATVEDVGKAFMFAWKNKAKGITVFRTGSRQKQVLNAGIDNQGTCKVCIN